MDTKEHRMSKQPIPCSANTPAVFGRGMPAPQTCEYCDGCICANDHCTDHCICAGKITHNPHNVAYVNNVIAMANAASAQSSLDSIGVMQRIADKYAAMDLTEHQAQYRKTLGSRVRSMTRENKHQTFAYRQQQEQQKQG